MTREQDAEVAGVFVVSSWTGLATPRFAGTGFADDAIIIGQKGFENYQVCHDVDPNRLCDGRFSAVVSIGDSVTAFTDCFGQDAIFYYASNGDWAVSNSFLALARHLHTVGARLSVRLEGLLPGFVSHSATNQLISNCTPIGEIKVLPKDAVMSVEEGRVCVRRRAITSDVSYEQSLIDFVLHWSSRLDAIIQHYGDAFGVDISGGLDTRVLLALMCFGGRDLSRVRFNSNRAWSEDYSVALELARHFGFSLASKAPRACFAATEVAYEMWKLGNLGVYQPVYWPISAAPPFAASLHGAGGECYRTFYAASVDALVANLVRATETSSVKVAIELGFREACEQLGVDPRSPTSTVEHYRNFRSRFHFGRNWYRSLSSGLFTPLASRELLAAAGRLTHEQLRRSQMHCDVLLLVDPVLASLAFDKPSKSFNRATVESSPFFRRRPRLERDLRTPVVYAGGVDSRAESHRRSNGELVSMLLADLERNSDAAVSLGCFTRDVVSSAVERIKTGTRIVTDAVPAAHIIAAGEIARLCNT